MHKFLARNSPEITHEQTLGGGVKGVIPNPLNHPPPPVCYGPNQNPAAQSFLGARGKIPSWEFWGAPSAS
jgi:hypothetical protein